jgi:hypothetical protein
VDRGALGVFGGVPHLQIRGLNLTIGATAVGVQRFSDTFHGIIWDFNICFAALTGPEIIAIKVPTNIIMLSWQNIYGNIVFIRSLSQLFSKGKAYNRTSKTK